MKILFAGTPEFAALSLNAILAAGHDVVLVLTQPDRPAGRGMKALASPVKRLAQERGLPVMQPSTLKDPATQLSLRSLKADAMVVAAYGLILPQTVLDIPRLGALNVHASLLPRWRGAAPIQRALLAGDQETGVCIMQMDAGLDTGPILLCESMAIAADETAQSLHDRLALLGAKLIVEALAQLEKGTIKGVPQPAIGVTYAHKLSKSESTIDWTAPAEQVERSVRAYSPFPGARSWLGGTEIKIWRSEVGRMTTTAAAPGEIIEIAQAGITVACGVGALVVLELQRPGGKRLPVAEFIRGFPLSTGARFRTP